MEYALSIRFPSRSTPRVAYCPARNSNGPPGISFPTPIETRLLRGEPLNQARYGALSRRGRPIWSRNYQFLVRRAILCQRSVGGSTEKDSPASGLDGAF